MTSMLVCALVGFIAASRAQTVDRPLVQLSTGPVRGWRIASNVAANGTMLCYKGIPYAQPPIGALRFVAPVAVHNWTTELNLPVNDSLQCPQLTPAWITESNYAEDCLVVNVYTPESAKSGDQLPVMVWIYGGALSGGSSSYSNYAPDYLVDQGVIFVSFNYRVGALGFLNLGTDAVPGNAGLKDQNLALRWVQKEISNFGGDPKQVTLFGESAGSTSVSFHYISPNSQGLFSKAICESGNAFSETTFLETGFLERAKALSGQLNCTDQSGNVNLTCLQSVDVTLILKYQSLNLSDEYVIPGNRIVFPATSEKSSATAVLTDTPQKLLAALVASNSTRVPLIMGVNHDEGTLLVTADADYYAQLPSKLQYFIRPSIRGLKTSADIANNVASINTEYFNNTPPSLTNLDGFIKLYGDKMFAMYTSVFARTVASFGHVYLYHFDYNGGFVQPNGPTTSTGINISSKVGHGEELGYIFYSAVLNQTTTAESSTDKITLRRMVKLWTNFAKYGNPTPQGANSTVLGGFQWTPISAASLRYLRVTDQVQMSADNFLDREVTFWSGIEKIVSSSRKSASSVLLLISALIFQLLLLMSSGAFCF